MNRLRLWRNILKDYRHVANISNLVEKVKIYQQAHDAMQEIIGGIIKQEENSMLLYPDMSRDAYEGSEHFCFSAPCTKAEWQRMYRERQTKEQSEHYLPFVVMTDESANEKVCVVLCFDHTTDEQAVTTAAWLRAVKEFNGMIYAVKYSSSVGDDQSLSQIIARTSGCNPKQVRHLDIITKEKEQDE